MDTTQYLKHSAIPSNAPENAPLGYKLSKLGPTLIAQLAEHRITELKSRWFQPAVIVAVVGTLAGLGGLLGICTADLSLTGRVKWLAIVTGGWACYVSPLYFLNRRWDQLIELAKVKGKRQPMWTADQLKRRLEESCPNPMMVNLTPADYDNAVRVYGASSNRMQEWTKAVKNSDYGYVRLTDGQLREIFGLAVPKCELEEIKDQKYTVRAHYKIYDYNAALSERKWFALYTLCAAVLTYGAAKYLRVPRDPKLGLELYPGLDIFVSYLAGGTGTMVTAIGALVTLEAHDKGAKIASENPWVVGQRPAWLSEIGLKYGRDYIKEQSVHQ